MAKQKVSAFQEARSMADKYRKQFGGLINTGLSTASRAIGNFSSTLGRVETGIGRAGINAAKELSKQYLYNPQTKEVLPQNLYAQTKRYAPIVRQYGINSQEARQAQVNMGMNLVPNFSTGIMAGVTKPLQRSSRVFIKFHPDDADVMKRFASTVDRLGKKANKTDLGQMGLDAQRVVEHYFGRKFTNLTNTRVKQLFDYGLAKREGGMVVKPKGVPIPAGLTAQEGKGLAQQALRKTVPKGSYTNNPQIDNPLYKTTQEASEKVEFPKNTFKPPPDTVKQDIDSIQRGLDVKKKVNVLDYLWTPEDVLKKIGLDTESKAIRVGYETYKKDLKNEITQVTNWYKQAPNPQSAQTIFKWLDGQPVTLQPHEQKVAEEIKSYLSQWADKLNLPKEKRITNYITHIFDQDLIKKEFDPELAKLIADKVPGSVYDPFLLKRYGIAGFKENVWEALDAYVKRATRKFNMDPALKQLKEGVEGLDLESYKYVQKYAERINLRPTEMDNLIDNFIKSTPVGYKFGQRPVANLTQKWRQVIFRGGLGLNVGSALRNLTQGVNTYAKLGEKYTFSGYFNLLRNGTKELFEQGILDDTIIQDRNVKVIKGLVDRMDKGLFALFDMAEKINRGAAYYGAKSKALSQGLNEQQAIEFAKKIVRETQFQFGNVDAPLALSSDLSKTLLQFQSYNIKQVEFLKNMAKNKEWAGIARFIAGSTFMLGTVGKLLGMKPQDLLPAFRIGSPITSLAGGGLKALSTDEQTRAEGKKDLLKTGTLLVPGGAQLKKTIEGVGAVQQGYSTSPTGRVQYPIEQTPSAYMRASLFGKYTLPEAQKYYQETKAPLGEKQSETLKQSKDQKQLYDLYLQDRKAKKEQTISNEEKVQRVQSIVNQLQSIPPEQRKSYIINALQSGQLQGEDIKSFIREIKKKSIKRTPFEEGVASLSTKTKAQYIKQELQGKTPEEKRAILVNYIQKGIVTKEVIKELVQKNQ